MIGVTYIVARDETQARRATVKLNLDPRSCDVRYLRSPQSVEGLRFDEEDFLVWCDRWWEHPEAKQIESLIELTMLRHPDHIPKHKAL